MDDQQKREIAKAFDTTPELLPFIPELLADLWALGSTPELIVAYLRPLNLPPASTRALDLGCGKGAVAINLAKELGFQALGIDLFEPFIQDARVRAEELGVQSLCRFENADMRNVLHNAGEFDVVIYASVGGVLGAWEHCVGKLRKAIRPGGYMVIDDGFLTKTTRMERAGYEHYLPHEETLRLLTIHGDTLLREEVISAEETEALNRSYTELIRRRAEQLAQQHPETADYLFEYMERQERESEILESEVTGAVWFLRRA